LEFLNPVKPPRLPSDW